MQQSVYVVGSPDEVAHHAEPLRSGLDFEIVDPAEVLIRACEGDLAIFLSEHFDRFRQAIQILKSRRVATLYMLDGILEWRNSWETRVDEPACPFTMRPVLAHKAACIGPSQARILDSWKNFGKTEVVGVPRFDRLAKSARSPRGTRTGTKPPGEEFRILVMTAKFPAFTGEQHERLGESLFDLKKILGTFPQTAVKWRLTGGWEKVLAVENNMSETSGVELARLLSEVDAVITSPSTAVLEAWLHDLPTAILDYHNTPSYVRGAWNISALGQIETTLAELQNPPEAKMAFQQMALRDELLLESSATERMIALVQGMLSETRAAIEAGRDLRFPDHILPSVAANGIAGTFQHERLFAEYREFQLTETTELQVQLAHARREINHLNSRLDQAYRELGEAHRIFDQIHNHPVAGPVVRLRGKLLSLWKRLNPSNRHSCQRDSLP